MVSFPWGVVCAAGALVIALLVLKICFLYRDLDQIGAQLGDRLGEKTNNRIYAPGNDRHIRAFAAHLNRELGVLYESRSRYRNGDRELKEAVTNISHDLRTPLTGIIGASSSYLENSALLPEEEKIAIITHIHEDANWLLNMVENLLAVTRIHDRSSSVRKTDESVEEIVSAAIMRLKKRLPEAAVNVAVPDELLIIPMDAILIEQVLINLLENAIVHSQSREPILCYVDADSTDVTFHVKDYGIGIDPDRLENIFDGNSYIGNKESDSNKGMGIGLSICKTILTAHGGTINAKNHARGAEFYFTLPKEGGTP